MRGTVPVTLFVICMLTVGCSSQNTYKQQQYEWNAAYDKLSPQDREAVRAGRLVYSAGAFSPAPALLPHPKEASMSPLHVQFPSGYWGCPAIPLDPDEWTDIDLGTFYGAAIANKPGQRFNAVLHQFVVPPPDDISFETQPDSAPQAAYVMIGAWSADPAPYTSLDAGLTWQQTGTGPDWFAFSNDSENGWNPLTEWRLRNKFDDTSQPLTGTMALRIVDDDTLELVITASGDSEWRNTDTTATQAEIVLPIELHGFPADGDDTTLNLQITFARTGRAPLAGSLVPDIGVFGLQYATWDPVTSTYHDSTPWDFEDPGQSEFLMVCPLDGIEEAYEFGGGSSDAVGFNDRFEVSIDIATPNVHIPCLVATGLEVYHTMNLSYLMPVPAGFSRTFFDISNCGRVSRTFDVEVDDSWADVSPPTQTVHPGPPERVSIVREYFPPSDRWLTCDPFGATMQTTTIRISESARELHEFPFVIDCTLSAEDQVSGITIRRADGAWIPPTTNQGRFYSSYYYSWAQTTCGLSLTPNLRKIRDYMSQTITVEYGVYNVSLGTYISNYSSSFTESFEAEESWKDNDFIDITLQTIQWWNEVVGLCKHNQL